MDRPVTGEEKLQRAREAVCLINSRGAVKWPGEVLRQLPRLRMITVCGIGTDAIDLEAARKGGSSYATFLAARLHRRRARFRPDVRRREAGLVPDERAKARPLDSKDNIYLRGKTLGLVGLDLSPRRWPGWLGRGLRVHAWTLHPSDERASQLGVVFVPLDELLRSSDVVSIHLKLTDRSRGCLVHVNSA